MSAPERSRLLGKTREWRERGPFIALRCVALHYVVVCRFFADKGANRRYLLLVLAWLWDLQMRVFFSWEGKGGGGMFWLLGLVLGVGEFFLQVVLSIEMDF